MPKSLELPKIVGELRHFYQVRKRFPSYAEMQTLFDYSSKGGVAKLVGRLIEEKIIAKDKQGRLIPDDGLGLGLKVLGSVQAGFPSPAEEDSLNTLSLDEFLVQKPEASYLVRVTGDSMIEAGIMPGDLVIVEKGRAPKNNDIVIAQIDGEWTLKRYRKDGSQIVLQPANRKYPVLKAREELTVAGVVVGSLRRYQ